MSLFSELPDHHIIDRKNYDKVVEQINVITTYNEFCPSIRGTFDRGGDGLSVSEIWGWDGMRVMDDLSWLNELWWNEEKKREENN
jgi:hypothetical protein